MTPNVFLPSIPNLPYQYATFTNFHSPALSVRNPEVAQDPDEILHASREAALERAGGYSASGYGEVTRLGFQQLNARMRLQHDDTFVDCGSGTGRTVLQAAREYGVRAACLRQVT